MDKFKIECVSVLGLPVWVAEISGPIALGEEMALVLSIIRRIDKAKVFTRAEAEEALPQVHTCHPEAKIIPA